MKKSTWLGCVLGVALGLSAGLTRAQTIVGIHTVSVHTEKGYNNTNPGVYLSIDGYTAGTYYNSERHQTYYVGYNFAGELGYGLDWGLTLGLATGYERSKVVPMLVPSVSLNLGNNFAVRLSAIPPFAKSPGVAHLSFERKF